MSGIGNQALNLDVLRRRWSRDGGMGNTRGAEDYTDKGCRLIAESAFRDCPALVAEVERLRGISAALFEELTVKDQAIEDIQKALDEGTWPGYGLTVERVERVLADLSARLDQDDEAQRLVGDEGEQQQ